MGYLGATLTQVFSGARGVDVSLRDVTIARDGKRGYRVQVMSHTGSARRIWGILKCQLVELSLAVRRRKVTFSCSLRPWAGVPRVGGGVRWKGQNRKNVYLSLYVEETLNSKVIKSFVPELRSRKCFSCFEIPMFYVYMLWTFYVSFTHIRIMGMVQTYLLLCR